MFLDNFLSQFIQTTDYPTLDAMYYIMKKLGNPEKKLKFIHVAGTNGKGSICEMLTKILIESNYKVGKFISPHLFESNESISINNRIMKDSEFQKYKDVFLKISEDYFKETGRHTTRFEILTSIAILYYFENNCDIVVFEVGLGGMYDSTNIVNSLISVFGSIELDHTAILGNSIEEIAKQKAGIIKQNSNTVIFEQPVLPVIEDACKEKNSKLSIITSKELSNYRFDNEFQYFDFNEFRNIQINLKGKKQIENASIVITCCKILNQNGFNITHENIYNGLKNIVHPARFEIISKKPLIIFDGAHNKNAMENFCKTVKDLYPTSSKTFVVSIITTKDYKADLNILLSNFKNCKFIFTSGTKEKFFPAETLFNYAKELNSNNSLETSDFNNAITNLDSEVNFIVGSFYVYEEARKIYKK